MQRICTVWVPVDLPKAPERVRVGYRDQLVCNMAIGHSNPGWARATWVTSAGVHQSRGHEAHILGLGLNTTMGT